MRAGPKVNVAAAPLDLSHLPPSGPERVIAFVEEFCIVPRGYRAGQPFRLHGFQRRFVEGAFGEGIVTAGLSTPRGNGKSGLCAALLVYATYGAGLWGPRVFACAVSQRQAELVWGEARAMVEANPLLTEQTQVHAHKLVVPLTDGLLEPLPATPAGLLGRAPALVVIDECAEVGASSFEAMQLGLGKVPGSKLIAISTSPTDPESSWNTLRELGRAREDPSLYWQEHAAPEECDPSDEGVWRDANPAVEAGFLSMDAIRSSYRTTRLESFMRYRLNMAVEDAGQWIGWGVFEGLADTSRTIAPGERLILAFDGSVGTDSTALLGVTIGERPHCAVLGLWEAPPGAREWRVPRTAVCSAVEDAFDRFDVTELVADPHWWQSEIQAWEARWPGRVLSWPTHVPSRMTKACDAAYALITEGRLSHDGDSRLTAHVRNCVVRQTSAGPVVTKDHKSSVRRIDAAIALIIGVDRALWHAHQPVKRRRVFVGSYS